MSREAALNLANTQNAPIAPATPAPAVSQENVDSRRLALFAKKEAQMQREREAFQKEQEEFKKQREQVDGVQKRAKEFDDLRTKDPVAALRLLGFSEADIFNFMAGQEKTEPTPEEIARKVAQEETQKVRDDLAKTQKENDEKRNKELIDGLKKDIGTTLKDKASDFKYCAFRGPEAEAQVFEYIDQVLRDHKILLSPEEAMKDVEELYKAEAEALLELSKPKEETAKPEPQTMISEEKPRAQVSPQPKTLTNKVTATASAVANAVPKKETPGEKRARLERQLAIALGAKP